MLAQAAARQADFADGPQGANIRVGDSAFVADVSGALWHRGERTLIVADLHLEKASRYAVRGQFLPPYDTAVTLARLSAVVAQYAPDRLICLGDSFHDVRALSRMAERDHATIDALSRQVHIVWVAGNHDPDMPAALPGRRCDGIAIDAIDLRHEPSAGPGPVVEICGHLHPAARVATPRGSMRRRCFAGDGSRLVIPAFGSLAGGLNIRDAAFHAIFERRRIEVHVLGRQAVYRIDDRHLFGD